jgi:hypothetical protein
MDRSLSLIAGFRRPIYMFSRRFHVARDADSCPAAQVAGSYVEMLARERPRPRRRGAARRGAPTASVAQVDEAVKRLLDPYLAFDGACLWSQPSSCLPSIVQSSPVQELCERRA